MNKSLHWGFLLLAGLHWCGCGSSSGFTGTGTNFPAATTNTTNNTTTNNNNNNNQAGSSINFTFSGNSNAITTAFPANTVVTGSLVPTAAAATGLLSQLTQPLNTPPNVGTRAININISDTDTLAVNDIFNVVASNQPTPRASINYTEQTVQGVFAFSSQGGGGTLRITSLTPGNGVGGTIGIELTNVNLSPVNQAGNSATGTLTINGTATLTF